MIINDTDTIEREETMPDISFMNADEYLKDAEIEKICFVCTGNTCRSPMAAALFNYFNKDKSRVGISAGISAHRSRISKNAVSALKSMGVFPTPENDFEGHISRTIDEKTMSECRTVIAVSGAHAMLLLGMFPHYASKIFAMPYDIPDPFGGDERVYRECLDEIKRGVIQMFPEFADTDTSK